VLASHNLPPRRIAIPLLPKVKAELERMEQMGVVSRVHEPTKWSWFPRQMEVSESA